MLIIIGWDHSPCRGRNVFIRCQPCYFWTLGFWRGVFNKIYFTPWRSCWLQDRVSGLVAVWFRNSEEMWVVQEKWSALGTIRSYVDTVPHRGVFIHSCSWKQWRSASFSSNYVLILQYMIYLTDFWQFSLLLHWWMGMWPICLLCT